MAQKPLFPRKVTREELNSLVDKAADLIRTAVDYKFILVLLFLKRLNDLWKTERQQVKDRLVKEVGLSEREAEEEAEREIYHTFNIPRQYLWDEVTKDVRNLPERLATGISEVAKLNRTPKRRKESKRVYQSILEVNFGSSFNVVLNFYFKQKPYEVL